MSEMVGLMAISGSISTHIGNRAARVAGAHAHRSSEPVLAGADVARRRGGGTFRFKYTRERV
jgi:hypothetical protein